MKVEVIIPTYDNAYWLRRCLRSLATAKMPELGIVHIVDNHGDFFESDYFCPGLELRVYKPGQNLKWTGALTYALPHVKSDFVLFLNDDTEFEVLPDRLEKLMSHFEDWKVGGVGPATSIALGSQAIAGPDIQEVKLLIGFCFLVRMAALREIGGLDEAFVNGGDDLDLSIRLLDAGYKLILDRRVFVYHHAFKTGMRLFGKANVPGGWNSQEMVSHVCSQITRKHGAEKLMNCIRDPEFHEETTPLGHH
jgi:GT2 family glycosyltransferase